MDEGICGYCEEEVNRTDLKWNYSLETYVCPECRVKMSERLSRYKGSFDEEDDSL